MRWVVAKTSLSFTLWAEAKLLPTPKRAQFLKLGPLPQPQPAVLPYHAPQPSHRQRQPAQFAPLGEAVWAEALHKPKFSKDRLQN